MDMQPNEKQCQIHRERGIRYYDSENYRSAIAEFKEALHHNPRDPKSWKFLAIIYGAAGHFEPAVSFAQKAVREDYEDMESWVTLMNLFSKIGGSYLHLTLEQFALAKDLGESADVYYLAGNAYYRLGDESRAYPCYKKAIELNPKHVYANREIKACNV